MDYECKPAYDQKLSVHVDAAKLARTEVYRSTLPARLSAIRLTDRVAEIGRTASDCCPPNYPSDFGLFGHLERVVDLDAEISDGTLQFCMTEQQLHGPEVFSTAVDQ